MQKSALKNLERKVETNAETNAKQIKVSNQVVDQLNFISLYCPSQDLTTTLSTTTTLALENKDTCEKVNVHSILIQTNAENLEVRKPQINSVLKCT